MRKDKSKELPGNPARRPVRTRVPFGTHGRLLRRLTVPVVMVLVGAMLVLSPAAPAPAACANPIVCENQMPGTPQSVWDVTSPSTAIQGFADPFSVNVGGSINFKIQTSATLYAIDIYRIGWPGRLRQLGGVSNLERPRDRGLRCLFRAHLPDRWHRREPDPVRSDRQFRVIQTSCS